ncbi:MAG: hypothetical protein ACE5HP_03785 [Gemmatimonadota bacterium]
MVSHASPGAESFDSSDGVGITSGSKSVPARVALAFAPVHKRVLGIAVGAVSGLAVAGLTVFHLTVLRGDPTGIQLLSQYFYGYEVSWSGAVIGGLWGFFAGFVAGWFAAFCRNLALAASIFLTRTRAELEATRDFLDHI